MKAITPEEEVQNGFTVSCLRKKVWIKEISILKKFIEICDTDGLKYFLDGGTMLGAVRHGGFIPWDDDIDVVMPRNDYERFLAVAPSFLPQNYFLQCSKTEVCYPNGHAQIRDSESACIRPSSYTDLKLGKNCGIFIDIFPYDCVPDGAAERKAFASELQSLKKKITRMIYWKDESGVKGLIKRAYLSLFCRGEVQNDIDRFDALVQKYNYKTDTVGTYSFSPGDERNTWPAEWFDEHMIMQFADVPARIPKHYDDILRHQFGDYMQFPEDKSGGGSAHGVCLFDPDRSYKEYSKYTRDQLNEIIKNFSL